MYIYTHTSYWFCFQRTLIHTHITLYWQKNPKKQTLTSLINLDCIFLASSVMTVLTGDKKSPVFIWSPALFSPILTLKQHLTPPYFCFLSHWTQWKLCEASPAVWVFFSTSHPLGKGRVFSCRSPAQRTANEHSIKIHSSSPHWEFPLQFQLDNDALCSLYYIKVWYISSACNKSASR